MVGEHDEGVATTGADRKPAHVVSVKLADWLFLMKSSFDLVIGLGLGLVERMPCLDWVR